jgi:hypothetical protein
VHSHPKCVLCVLLEHIKITFHTLKSLTCGTTVNAAAFPQGKKTPDGVLILILKTIHPTT